jgi:Na+/H+ antiporter NhaD/arsenite permease-like protein
MIGAAAPLAIGALDSEEVCRTIDIPTLVILTGMIVINGALEAAGFSQHTAVQIIRVTRHRRILLDVIMAVSAVLSAIFLNDTSI